MNYNDYFLFNRVELERLNKLMDEHLHNGIFIIRKSDASGIGQNLYVTCDKCQKEFEITDYESW